MTSDEQQRWLEISRSFDEAVDLDEPSRSRWLSELDSRAPTIAYAVRSMLNDREQLGDDPLLADDGIALSPPAGLSGQRIGAYTLERVVGQGGMGTVWLAHRSDGRYEGRAAIKFLNASLLGRPTEQRFVREGSVLAKLQHPNIAKLTDAGVALNGQPYLVLEYVEGQPIDQYADERKLTLEQRIGLFLDVIAAVAHAHSHLIVHRDIKPSNILVTNDGVVKLLDFGVAALLGPEDTGLTREVDPGLTPGYAAPEQILRQPVTTATDVYALGLVLFLLLTGKHPFEPERKSAAKVAQETIDEDPPAASHVVENRVLARSLRGDLDTIVAKALKKLPSERYLTVDALGQDLRSLLASQPIAARPDSFVYRANKFVRRHRGAVASGVAVVVTLIAATVLTTWQMLEARRQRDAAIYQSQRAEFQARFAYKIMSEVGGDGQPITIRELMEKGIEVLENNYRDDPRFVIGMLVNISGRYMDLGDTNGEYAALVKAEQLARKLGDPERVAYVQCNTVETELAMGRLDRARERMSDGLARLAEVRNPTFQRESECKAAEARLLWAEGNLPGAIEVAKRLAEYMESTQRTDDLLYNKLASMLDVMLVAEGRRKEARDWNRRLIVALERSTDASGMGMATARHNEAGHLFDAGEIAAALDVQRKLVEPLAAQEGADNVPSSYAHRLGLYMVRVEENDAGFDWIDRGVRIGEVTGDRSSHIGALLSRARAHLMLGRLSDAQLDIEAAERVAAVNTGEYKGFLRNARVLRAELLVQRADYTRALQAIDALLIEVGYPQKQGTSQIAQLLMLKSRSQLALGQTPAAVATATEGLKSAEANTSDASRSALVGAALMTLAHAQRRQGDLDAARSSAQRAAAALAAGLGPDHSETRTALKFY